MAELSYEEILALLEPEPEPSVLTPEERAVQDDLMWWTEKIR